MASQIRASVAYVAISLVSVALVSSFGQAVWAGPLEDGKAAHLRKDYQAAMALLRPLADQGNPVAQCEVGQLYEEGMGGEKHWDMDSAFPWFQKAADQGNVQAQTFLGFYYLNKGQGFGAMADQPSHDGVYQPTAAQSQALAESLKWFHKAGNLGDARALWRIGRAYEDGLGGADGLGAAYAADSPHYSYNELRLLSKFGVPRDYVQAYKWYSLAADSGNNSVARQRDALAAKLTPSQLSEGKRQAAQWRAHHPKPIWSEAC